MIHHPIPLKLFIDTSQFIGNGFPDCPDSGNGPFPPMPNTARMSALELNGNRIIYDADAAIMGRAWPLISTPTISRCFAELYFHQPQKPKEETNQTGEKP